MRAIVNYRELEHGHQGRLPSLRRAVGRLSAADARVVVPYLQAGLLLVDCMGLQRDPLTPEASCDGGMSLLTDGVWWWWSYLEYFVDRYRVWVPPAFVAHARVGSPLWLPPGSGRVGALACDAWNGWRNVLSGGDLGAPAELYEDDLVEG